ncbi:MAG: winged helix-turn-helix transcriptional regulator [Nitrospirae bacterium]|nr:winged helix-turn-helix transcriptional regulator [Nitrospirota bacterium]
MNKPGSSKHDNITLRILNEINSESLVTQRTLSSKLNIALGLVNAYIKRLARKGHIKINKGPMNRVKYALTPKGFAHRVDLTYHYMQSSINYFKDARQRIDSIYGQMIEAGIKNILIWGDGEIAELSYLSLRGLPLNLVGVVDGNKEEKGFFGYHIYSYNDVPKLDYDAILIASFNEKELNRIKTLGIDAWKIYSL